MDKEAQEKIAVYVAKFNGGLDYSSLEKHRQETYMEIGRDILALIGYRKPPICQKCGSPILLSQNISGLRANCGCSGTPIDFPIDNRWAKPNEG